jgi:hypothetical protein
VNALYSRIVEIVLPIEASETGASTIGEVRASCCYSVCLRETRVLGTSRNSDMV